MKISHKALITISCISFSLYPMEKNEPIANSSIDTKQSSNNKHFYVINDVYKQTYNTLENYNPKDNQSIIAITEIIAKTQALKDHGINIKTAGSFAYKQPNNNTIFTKKNPPYHNPLYVSVCFERIAQYNAFLEKNEFSSPTYQELMTHMNNKKKIAVIAKAAKFNVFINFDKIDSEKKIIQEIPNTVAIQEFITLTNDISAIQSTTPEEIQILAHTLYSSAIQPESSEKL